MKTVHTIPELVREAKEGLVALEVDGARYIVQDEVSFARAEEERFVASLVQSEADYEAGRGKTVAEVRAELRDKHGF